MNSLLLCRAQNDESSTAGDGFAVAEDSFELDVMVEVAVADDPEFSAFFQCRMRLLEHAPGRGVVNSLMLVERGVTEDEVGTFFRCSGEPVADGERHFARAAKCRLEIGVG